MTNSAANLVAPIIIGNTIDGAIRLQDYHGVLVNAGILMAIYLVGSFGSYVQTRTIGGVGRRLLYKIRNNIFQKLQDLPIAFFNQNKSGDLISRINNDTEKLNAFISQGLIQFISNFFLISGAGIFVLVLDWQLGLATLAPAALVLIVTLFLSPWIKRKNLASLRSLGSISSEIQESLSNFKIILAFNRLDYFVQKFREFNDANYAASVGAGVASNIFVPIYGLASNLASLISLCFGLYLISTGSLTIGLLISFTFYVNNFYSPLRQLASVWSGFQLALASLDRVGEVMNLETNIDVGHHEKPTNTEAVLELSHVSFRYSDSGDILRDISFVLEKGKTYAFVGPTGGGKTTTASLMARLYDPTQGTIFLDGRDIRSYSHEERTKKIGFILQEPFLFSGTLQENIVYGNQEYQGKTEQEILDIFAQYGLTELVERFDGGLSTPIVTSKESMSLGQKQLIAFIRAFLRHPEFLILDEATANIDTVTEQLLDAILDKLPKETTKVIIAHRLNTIKNADEIFFVNAGSIVETGSMEKAIEMILHGKRGS